MNSLSSYYAGTLPDAGRAVLAYHGVDDPERFHRQVQALTSNGSTPHLTFDDGERTVLEYAVPFLRKRRVSATIFVVAGLIDTDLPFWWNEVRDLVRYGGRSEILVGIESPEAAVRHLKYVSDEQRIRAIDDLRNTASRQADRYPHLTSEELRRMYEAGFEIGNHTLSHPCLDRCSTDKIRHELQESQRILTAVLGEPPKSIAYPNGNQDERVIGIARELGFERGFLFDHRLNRKLPADPLRISRLRVNSTTPMWKFRLIVSGIHPMIHHAIGRN